MRCAYKSHNSYRVPHLLVLGPSLALLDEEEDEDVAAAHAPERTRFSIGADTPASSLSLLLLALAPLARARFVVVFFFLGGLAAGLEPMAAMPRIRGIASYGGHISSAVRDGTESVRDTGR